MADRSAIHRREWRWSRARFRKRGLERALEFVVGVLELDEPFIDPTPAVVTSPDPSTHHTSGHCSTRNEHGPQMPDIRPSWSWLWIRRLDDLVLVGLHARGTARFYKKSRAAKRSMVA